MEDNIKYASITQRSRGVYLVNVGFMESGDEVWDAFSTAAKAKQWCGEQLGAKWLRWEEIRKPGHWPRWYTEVSE